MSRTSGAEPGRPAAPGMRRVGWVMVLVVLGVVAFLAGGLARALLADGGGAGLVASAGEVKVNGDPVTESTALRVGDVVEVAGGQADIFLSEDRWLRLTPDAQVVLSDEETIEHRDGTGWYRAAEEPLGFKAAGIEVLVEGAALVVDDVILVADGFAEVDGRRVEAGEAVVDGEVIDLAADQVYGDPRVKAHLKADHRSEALAAVPFPSAEGSLLGEYLAKLTVVSSEFTDQTGTRLEREADVILRCETRPCSMVLRLARSDGWVELPLSWSGTGYTSDVATSWPCLTDQRLVGDDVYQAHLELEMDISGTGTLILDLAESSQSDICHTGTAAFAISLGQAA